MYLKFAGDVAPMRDDGVDANAKVVGNFLVRHSLHKADDDILFALAEHLVVGILTNHLGDFHRDIVLLGMAFQPADGRDEYLIFYLRVLCQPFLVVVNVVERGRELVVVHAVAGQVFDDDVLQLAQFLVGLSVMLRESVDVVVARHLIVEQGINIREHHFLLVFHVRTYLVRILIIELHDKACQIQMRWCGNKLAMQRCLLGRCQMACFGAIGKMSVMSKKRFRP